MKEKSFRVYIHRTLKTVGSDLHITKVALEAVDSIVRVTANHLVERALSLTTGSDKKTVSCSELQAATRLVLPTDLAQASFIAGTSALEKFQDSETQRAEAGRVEKAQTRESRAGLIFSVSATEKYLRCFGQNNYHIAAFAPVYLAGVLQYLTSELLELSGNQAREAKKVTITVRHLFLAVTADAELRRYVDNLGVVFLEAGVEAHIEDKLLTKKPRKRLAPTGTGIKRPHRWRPGTKTIMDMKRLQKSSDLLMQHAPFNRLAREVGEGFQAELRCSGEFLTSLQAFVEDRVVRVMRQANRVALHANRETVYARDVKLTRDLIEPELRTSSVSYQSNIPEAALRKMALRAGIKRYGDDSTQAYRDLLVEFLENYMRDIVVCAQLHKVQTLNTKLLLEALGMRGLYPSITAHKRRTHKKGAGSRSTSQAESLATSEAGDVSDVEKDETEALATIDE